MKSIQIKNNFFRKPRTSQNSPNFSNRRSEVNSPKQATLFLKRGSMDPNFVLGGTGSSIQTFLPKLN